MNINLTNAQTAALEQTLRNSFNMGALADLGHASVTGRTLNGAKFDATMSEVFDLAALCDKRQGLSLSSNPNRLRVAVSMFRCIRLTAISEDDMDAIISSGLARALRQIA